MLSKEHLIHLNAAIYPQKNFNKPNYIVLGVNNICNLHCKMCDVGTKDYDTVFAQNLVGTHPMNMPANLVKKVIDDMVKYFPKAKLGYAFTEPLVYPHLIETLGYAKQNNIFTSITTNALTLKNKAKDLVEVGLNELNISLDGPPEIHNMIRGHKSSFEKALEGIAEINKYDNPPEISIFCTITYWNIQHLRAFLRYFSDLSIKRIGFMHTVYTSPQIADLHNVKHSKYQATASNFSESRILDMDVSILSNELQQIKNEAYSFDVSFSPDIYHESDLDIFYRQPEIRLGNHCYDVYKTIMIKSDGSVIPAHGRCFNIEIGNMYQHSLKKIWDSAMLT